MEGLSIVQGVYMGLRRPSESALPYRDILRSVRGVIARKKFDLALSPQNSLGITSEWFTPNSSNFSLEDLGLEGNVLLPVRVEWRSLDSESETGSEVPLVNYDVLNTSINGAASFYGSPLRMVFRDNEETVVERQYRLIYEPDFSDPNDLDSMIDLPEYVQEMIEFEAMYKLVDLVENSSPEWMEFKRSVEKKWPVLIADWRDAWDRYVAQFRGKAQVPKRTFWQNRGYASRTKYFKG